MKSEKEQDQKFLASGQEKLRLQIALERFVELEPEEAMYSIYREYLVRRFRPAMESLIRAQESLKAEKLFSCKEMTPGLLEELLGMASGCANTECYLWLLEQKRALYGFERKDMEL